jgi:hypothetical protein
MGEEQRLNRPPGTGAASKLRHARPATARGALPDFLQQEA